MAGGRAAGVAVVAGAAGAALVLPYYGVEAFGLAALGRAVTGDGALDPAPAGALADSFRLAAWPAGAFLAGLLAVAVAGVALAVALWRPGGRARVGAVLVAAALVGYLPQFFATPDVRIAHGVLLGVGCLLVAAGPARRTPSDAGP